MRQRITRLLLALCILTPVAEATWSIVVVDRRTGEVGVAAATCIPGDNLRIGLPCIVVGEGGGVNQAAGLFTNVVTLGEGLRAGLSAEEVLARVVDGEPSPQFLQAAVVRLDGSAATFTGTDVDQAWIGVTGESGDLVFAIQGNVLTGIEVVHQARSALLETEGDLSQKLLAAMEAARAMGGDGRCSCSAQAPDSCGAPPPSFQKSAHAGILTVARIGDPEGACTSATNCTNLDAFLFLNVRRQDALVDDPDPVFQLQERYATWRTERVGRPDGLHSVVEAFDALPADGRTKRRVTVRLHDIEGDPLTSGGATLSVRAVDGFRTLTQIGPVSDHGDGTYSFGITAGTQTGVDRLRIEARDDLVRATLQPDLLIRSEPVAPLHGSLARLPGGAGAELGFVLNAPRLAGAPYRLLAALPRTRGTRALVSPGPAGVLDAHGRAEARLRIAPGTWAALTQRGEERLSWRALVQDGVGWSELGPVEILLQP